MMELDDVIDRVTNEFISEVNVFIDSVRLFYLIRESSATLDGELGDELDIVL